MTRSARVALIMAAPIAATISPIGAQWLNYQTAGVPRTPDGKPNLSAPAPRTADGKPDLSGMWDIEHNLACPPGGCLDMMVGQEFWNIGWGLKDGLPYQPWARELMNARKGANSKDSPDRYCLPTGVIKQHAHPLFRKIVQVPGVLVILYERNAMYRQIFTDGRPLPIDPQPSFNGYSSGRWSGDTLVVETNGLRDGLWADNYGSPLTDAAKITERFRRPDFGRLELEITVDDPKAYTRPWTVALHQHLKLDSDLLDYICLENEKDASHLK